MIIKRPVKRSLTKKYTSNTTNKMKTPIYNNQQHETDTNDTQNNDLPKPQT